MEGKTTVVGGGTCSIIAEKPCGGGGLGMRWCDNGAVRTCVCHWPLPRLAAVDAAAASTHGGGVCVCARVSGSHATVFEGSRMSAENGFSAPSRARERPLRSCAHHPASALILLLTPTHASGEKRVSAYSALPELSVSAATRISSEKNKPEALWDHHSRSPPPHSVRRYFIFVWRVVFIRCEESDLYFVSPPPPKGFWGSDGFREIRERFKKIYIYLGVL